MSLYSEGSILEEDLKEIANWEKLPIAELEGSDIVISGATGLIGSLLVRSLAAINDMRAADIHIYAMARNEDKFRSIYGEAFERKDLSLVLSDLTDKKGTIDVLSSALKGRDDSRALYYFHCAAVTTSRTMVEKPVDTIRAAIDGTEAMLESAHDNNATAFVYISSMEVYGTMDSDKPVTEECMGYVDPLKIRSNYPLTKRMCENLCVAYSSQYGLDVKIARLAQTFGAGVLPGENRVFAQFARSVIRKENIVLHTRGLSEGNYCYSADVVRGLLTIAVKGDNGQAYNVCNEESHTTIAAMAEMVADKLSGGIIRIIYDIPEDNVYGYAGDVRLRLSSSKLEGLGWKPVYGLADSYRRLIEYLLEVGEV
ncbi:NAD-dependent epimerase/dehydratase family protein [Butyrivibrio sp. MC2013]|uniref:NAD-dependent epimerase/dehydratase family protein n=1 Tax=Butyrivibrio sp. MC2013 TaxID=1280686 RepID=UPI0004143740|nr:NAD(P)-dependent oxidoreductase [Butyrivibrio sp. MC2013]